MSDTLTASIARLQQKAAQQKNLETVRQEWINGKNASEGELRVLAQLDLNYSGAFGQLTSLDPDLLRRASINASPVIDAASSWLADLKQAKDNHSKFIDLAAAPDPNVPLEEVLTRIKSIAGAAGDLRARAETISAQIEKLA